MKNKYFLLGLFVVGILIVSVSVGYGFEVTGDGEEGDGGDEIPDEDKDGIDDDVEDSNKRDIEVWIGENVIEVASIRRQEEKKDIIDLRVGFNEWGVSVRVSYGTFVKCENEEPPESEKEIVTNYENYCEYEIEYKLKFEVMFRGLVEFVDMNENGVLDEEVDEIISDYGFYEFQPIDYSLTSISDDSNLHYILLNTTDGVFALHIFLVEEFVYVNETLISPTQAKIDIEITNYPYLDDNSQLALITKLWSEEKYRERDETYDEKEGYSDDEKDVFIKKSEYSGFFSWKETALIDGVEMDVFTKELNYEDEHLQKLLICYPRGNHIYHDPKIGIFISQSLGAIVIIFTGTLISVIGAAVIVILILRKRRIL